MSTATLSDRLQRVRDSFIAQPFMKFIGASITMLNEGSCHIAVPFNNNLTQQHGLFYGGLLATLADNSAGFAACSQMETDVEQLSVEFKINFTNKAIGSELIAKSPVIKNGKTLKVCNVELTCLNDGKESICAVAIVTIMAVQPF